MLRLQTIARECIKDMVILAGDSLSGGLDAFQEAIDRIFVAMDWGFAARTLWESTNDRARMLLATLVGSMPFSP
jgi:hypothetical protein